MGRYLLMLLLMLSAGCHTPRTDGPWFSLPPVPQATADASALPVVVTDARPKWERSSHEGTLTFASLEEFDVSPLRYLEHEVREQARKLPAPPVRAHVVLTSFRVIINDEPKQAAIRDERVERQEKEQEEREAHDRFFGRNDERKDSGNSFGDFAAEIVGAIVGRLLQSMVNDAIAGDGVTARPRQLVGIDYAPGATCDMAARVKLVWADGREQAWDLGAVANSVVLSPESRSNEYRGEEVQGMVAVAVREIGARLYTKATGTPDDRPAPQPAGDWTDGSWLDATFGTARTGSESWSSEARLRWRE